MKNKNKPRDNLFIGKGGAGGIQRRQLQILLPFEIFSVLCVFVVVRRYDI